MVGRITLDVAPGTPASVTFALLGMVVLMIVLEGGILALWGMRPVSKAFTSSFLANAATIGAGIVLFMVGIQLGLKNPWQDIFVTTAAVAVQGFVLAANRAPLSLGRIWLAAISMKTCSILVLILLKNLLGI